MGLIRTILALSVVCTHTMGYVFVGGALAVRLFYIISGFLISYVLVESKSYDRICSFYTNRALRLYPLYLCIALLTLIAYAVTYWFGYTVAFFDVYRDIDNRGFLALAVSNVTLFGQDWIMFTGVKDGVFQFTGDFHNSEIQVWQGLLVPQAWTLGVELTFYLMAPFVLLKKWRILCALVLSLLVRAYMIAKGFAYDDPWNYRFFPAEVLFFLIGALAHQVLRPIYTKVSWLYTKGATLTAVTLIALYCLVFFLLPYKTFNTLLMIVLVSITLPLLFEYQRASTLDRKIGDLSYPIYICHMLVIYVVDMIVGDHVGCRSCNIVRTIIIVCTTIAVSYASERFLTERVERIRERIKGRKTTFRPSSVETVAQ